MIAEDQAMVRQALVALLGLEPDIEVVAQAATGDEALAMAGKHQPDVAVLDIEMRGPAASTSPGSSGGTGSAARSSS
jgi:two-component system response regulator DesR